VLANVQSPSFSLLCSNDDSLSDPRIRSEMTATEVFESVSNGGVSDFSALVDVLNQHGLWCVVDGLAVNCYVEPVFTMDVDIVVASSERDSSRIDRSWI